MARTLLLLLIGLAIVAGMSWWLLSSGDPGRLRPDHGDGAASNVTAKPGSGALATDRGNEPPATTDRSIATGAPIGLGEITDDAEWLVVTIVDEHDQPIAGAAVDWVHDIDERFDDTFGEDDVEAFAAQHGRHTRSDASGRIRIVTGENSAWVFARHEDRYGHDTFWPQRSPPPGGFRLVIRPEVQLAVLVLDAQGQPAEGVPVVLLERESRNLRIAWDSQRERKSGADGLVIWEHAQQQQRYSWGARAGQSVPWWEITTAVPGLEVASLWIDAQAPPSEPPVLQLPATGHLRLQVTIGNLPPQVAEPLRLVHIPPSERALRRTRDAQGWAEFRHLPLGQTFLIYGHRWQVEVAGPETVGEVREVRIDLAAQRVALTGRIVDERGEAIREVRFLVEFTLADEAGAARITTDVNGRFATILRDDAEPDAALQLSGFSLRRLDDRPGRTSLPTQFVGRGVNDVGELRVELPPLVAAGRLEFDCDRPVRTQFEVQWFDRDNSNPWSTVGNLQVELRDDRSFEIRGEAPPVPLRLLFHAFDFVPREPFEFRRGDRNLVIPMQCGSLLTGSCIPPTGLSAHQLVVSLRIEGAPWQPVANEWPRSNLLGYCWPEADGKLQLSWPALANGSYTLAFAMKGLDGPVAELHDIAVPPPPNGDPRLFDIDLRAAVSTLQLTFDIEAGADGKVRPSVQVFLLPQQETAMWQASLCWELQFTLPVTPGPHDLLIAQTGYQPVSLRSVQGSAHVSLRQWPRLDLQLIGAEALPDGAQLMVQLERPAPTTRRPYRGNGSAGFLDDLLQPPNEPVLVVDSRATVSLGEGNQRLVVEVVMGEQRRALTAVTPREVMAGSLVTVQLSADEVAQAVAALRGH